MIEYYTTHWYLILAGSICITLIENTAFCYADEKYDWLSNSIHYLHRHKRVFGLNVIYAIVSIVWCAFYIHFYMFILALKLLYMLDIQWLFKRS